MKESDRQISDEQELILKNNFNLFYHMFSQNKFVSNASFQKLAGFNRYFSGVPNHYNNSVIGTPESHYGEQIEEQLSYFAKLKMPFVWYVNDNEDPEFKEKLKAHGFKDVGIFRGVIGSLGKTLSYQLPDNCELEFVSDESKLIELNDLVCSTFGIQGISKQIHKNILLNLTQTNPQKFCHWIARYDGKVVSAVSTLIEKGSVSFWNGATIQEYRRHGFSTALRCFALNDAISKGCRTGMSFLMAEGLALGICKKLGYQTRWRFNAFLSPSCSQTISS